MAVPKVQGVSVCTVVEKRRRIRSSVSKTLIDVAVILLLQVQRVPA